MLQIVPVNLFFIFIYTELSINRKWQKENVAAVPKESSPNETKNMNQKSGRGQINVALYTASSNIYMDMFTLISQSPV